MNSMTGFGTARGKVGRSHVVIEARSVNHRFSEVSLRFPGRFAAFEPEVARRVRQLFSRGKFDLFLREESTDREGMEIALARKTHRLLLRIRKELSLKSEITLSDLLSFRGILFSHRDSQDETGASRVSLLKLVGGALSGLRQMREREGKRLQHWFEGRLKRLQHLLTSIERESRRLRADRQRQLEQRFPEEVSSERSDVTEEIVRLRSHLKEFRRFLHRREPMGRKFDFLAQEMGREINTIGSKALGVRLTRDVVEFKGELERIKEQIQNIE